MTGQQSHLQHVDEFAGDNALSTISSWIDWILPAEERDWADFAHPTTTTHAAASDDKDNSIVALTSRIKGAQKRDEFIRHASQDPIRKGADVFARQLLERLGFPRPYTIDMTRKERNETETEYDQRVDAVMALIVTFAEYRERSNSFRTLCGRKRLNEVTGKKKARLRRNFAYARDVFRTRLETMLTTIGFEFITDDELTTATNTTFDELVEYADRVDHRRLELDVTYRCRATLCALIQLAEDYDQDDDEDNQEAEGSEDPESATAWEMTSYHAYATLQSSGLLSPDVRFIDYLNGDFTFVDMTTVEPETEDMEAVETARPALIDLCTECSCDCDALCKEDHLRVYPSLAAYVAACRTVTTD